MAHAAVVSAAGEAHELLVEVYGSALGASPGAEIVGVVAEAGAAVSDLLGRPVLVPRALPCGACRPCQRGKIVACERPHPRGGPVPQERVPARFVVPLGPPLYEAPVDLASLWRYAALPDALAAPHAGLVRAGVCPGDTVVLVAGAGTGYRAAGAALVLKALGCKGLLFSADPAQRAALAEEPFALDGIDALALDAAAGLEALRERTRGSESGVCVLEVTGTDAGRERALGLAEVGGAVVLLGRVGPAAPGLGGAPRAAALEALQAVVDRQAVLIGAAAPHPDLLPELVALVGRAGVDLGAFTTAVAPADIDAVLAARRRGEAPAARLPVVRFR